MLFTISYHCHYIITINIVPRTFKILSGNYTCIYWVRLSNQVPKSEPLTAMKYFILIIRNLHFGY